MSIINKVSLCLTPNAVKEGKLYSIIPSNGNGDMTVVRATPIATRTNELGLIELTPYNLLGYSEDFSNASWNKTRVTISPNVTTAPNGTMTADKLIEDTAIGNHNTQQPIIPANQGFYTFSCFIKKSERTWIVLLISTGTGECLVWYNVDNGTIGTITNGTGSSSTTATIENIGDGWYRCSMTINKTSTTTGTLGLFLSTGNNIASYTGNGSSGLFIWGAQLVQGSVPKDYFYTTDRLNVPRLNYDVAGGCPSILVEPLRTNLVLRSEEFENAIWSKTNATVIANTTTAPNGTTTADKLVEDTATGVHRVFSAPSSVAGITYTQSIYVKEAGRRYFSIRPDGNANNATFDLQTGTITNTNAGTSATITSVGNGWYRCTATRVASITSWTAMINLQITSDATTSYTGDGTSGIFIWGAQLELGAYSTSYIPTTIQAITRNTDVITRNNIYTNNLITSAGGTWFIELNNNFSLTRDTAGNGIWIGDNSSSSTTGNSLNIRHNGGTSRLSVNKCIGSSLTGLYGTLTNTVKIAIDWNGTTADVFVNGVKVVTGTAFTSTNMEFLNSGVGGGCVPKYIKSMMLFPTPLTDAECIALTSYFFNSYLDMAKYLNYTIQ